MGGEYRLVDTDDTSVEVAYDFSQTLYQDLTDFDLQTHGLYIAGSREWRGVDLGLSYQYSRVYLGGDDFLGIHSVSPSVGFSPADRWYTVVAYNYQNKNFIDTSARDAGRHDFGGTAFYVLTDSGALVSLGYEVQSENANGPAFDYFGQEVAFRAIAPYSILTRPVTFEFEYVYWNRDYRNITPSIGAERDDDRHRFRVDASTPVHEYFDFVLSYELINSNSNLPSNDFSENIVTVSVKAEY